MNIIVGVFADEIIAELGYTSTDKRIDRRNVIVRMDIEYRNALMALVYGGMFIDGKWQISMRQQVMEPPDVFYKTNTTTVQYDCDRQRYFALMPTDYVTFQTNNCIRNVCSRIDPNDIWVNQKLGAASAFGLLESATLAGQKGFELEGNKMLFNNMPSGVYDNKEIYVTYIAAVGGMAETDMLPLSGEMARGFMDAVKMAFGLQLQIPEDKTTDSVSNP